MLAKLMLAERFLEAVRADCLCGCSSSAGQCEDLRFLEENLNTACPAIRLMMTKAKQAKESSPASETAMLAEWKASDVVYIGLGWYLRSRVSI